MRNIEIFNNAQGIPKVRILRKAGERKAARGIGISNIVISLSHEKVHAIAFAVIFSR